MEPAPPSRIEEARRRASRAKTALGAGAAACSSYDDDGFSYGSGSIAPSGGSQPQVGTSVS
jgi:hypothetical protein